MSISSKWANNEILSYRIRVDLSHVLQLGVSDHRTVVGVVKQALVHEALKHVVEYHLQRLSIQMPEDSFLVSLVEVR